MTPTRSEFACLLTASLSIFCLVLASEGPRDSPRDEPVLLVSKSIFVADPQSKTPASDTLEAQQHDDSIGDHPKALFDDLLDEHQDGVPASDKQLQTSGQFEDSVKPQLVDATLLQTITNRTNQTSDERTQELSIERLNRDFLSFFDELWLIKNASAKALIRLDYFNQTIKTMNQTANNQESNKNCPSSPNGQSDCAPQSPNANNNNWSQHQQDQRTKQSQVGHVIKQLGSQIFSNKQEQARAKQANIASKLTQVATRVNSWLSASQQRLAQAKDKLRQAVIHKLTHNGLSQTPKRASTTAIDRSQNQTLSVPDSLPELAARSSPDDDLASPEVDLAGKVLRTRRKRDLPTEAFSSSPAGRDNDDSQQSDNCNKLTIDEENKCRSMELMINANLNLSFPGTGKAIEENCHHITFLLSSCWPQQLMQLKVSLSSWNESLLALADFPLPAGFTNSPAKLLHNNPTITSEDSLTMNSCGIEPQSPQYIRDRVSWMWLNLCIDKRFRQDYIDNLRCLSTWNQEKAQSVCNHEYRRMQNYLTSQTNGQGAFEWPKADGTSSTMAESNGVAHSTGQTQQFSDSASATNRQSTNQLSRTTGLAVDSVASASNPQLILPGTATRGLSETELIDREISSKMLCCMFDQFLRCVHKQAIRDCGRPGAQFVVNFMSRIGTDDMKYLCNADSKGNSNPNNYNNIQRQLARPNMNGGVSGGGSRRNSGLSDRNPFIDNNYCHDPRIQSALYSNGGGDRGSGPGASTNPGTRAGGASGDGPGLSGSRNKARPSGINYDPTFFGTHMVAFSGTATSTRFGDCSLTSYILSLASSLVLVWWLLPALS